MSTKDPLQLKRGNLARILALGLRPGEPFIALDDPARPVIYVGDLSGTPRTATAVGPPGLKGDQGDTGLPGADSTVAGPKGDTGTAGADSTVPGPKGDTGDQGIQGIAGAASVVPGPKGDTGTKGDAGNPGSQGIQGVAGANSTVPGPTGPGVPLGGTTHQMLRKIDGTDLNTEWADPPAGGGGGSPVRSSATYATAVLQDGATEAGTLALAKSADLLTLTCDFLAWVRVYSSDAARTADAGRLMNRDPDPGAGVILDAQTSGTLYLSPVSAFYNADGTPTSTAYLAITNRSGGPTALSVSLVFVPKES